MSAVFISKTSPFFKLRLYCDRNYTPVMFLDRIVYCCDTIAPTDTWRRTQNHFWCSSCLGTDYQDSFQQWSHWQEVISLEQHKVCVVGQVTLASASDAMTGLLASCCVSIFVLWVIASNLVLSVRRRASKLKVKMTNTLIFLLPYMYLAC